MTSAPHSGLETYTSDINFVCSIKLEVDAIEERIAWKKDLRSARLCCKTFASLRPINAALFYDFYLYFTTGKLAKLRAIAECDHLRPYVRRVIFMRPQIDSQFLDRGEYGAIMFLRVQLRLIFNRFEGLLKRSLMSKYRSAFQTSDVASTMRSSGLEIDSLQLMRCAEQLADAQFATTYPEAALMNYWRDFSQAYDDQARLMKGSVYTELGGSCLRKLPKLEAAIICGGNGTRPGEFYYLSGGLQLPNPIPCWTQMRFPELDIDMDKYTRNFGPLDETVNHFNTLVLRLLTVAQVPLTSLVSV